MRELLARVGERRGGGAGDDGEARLVQLDLVERGAERRDRGLIDGEWNAPATGEPHRAPAARRRRLGAVEVRAVAGEHDLAGRVVVGDGQVGGGGDLLGLAGVGADQREHRAAVVGLRHQPAAQHDQLERVVDAQRAGGGEGAQLAERVPGGGGGAPSQAAQPAIEAQKIAGCWKRVLSSTRGKGSSPTSSVTAREQLGAALGDEVAHLGGLLSLAWEQQRDGAHAGHPCPCARGFRIGGPLYPPCGGVLGARWGVLPSPR